MANNMRSEQVDATRQPADARMAEVVITAEARANIPAEGVLQVTMEGNSGNTSEVADAAAPAPFGRLVGHRRIW